MFKLFFQNNNTVKSILIRNSPNVKTGCIYEVPCADCDKRYLGQSGKELSVRIKQHKYCIRTANSSSAIFLHMSQEDHRINWLSSKELIFCNDFTKRNIIESSFIKWNCEKIMNVSPGMYKLDSYLVSRIVKQFNFCK